MGPDGEQGRRGALTVIGKWEPVFRLRSCSNTKSGHEGKNAPPPRRGPAPRAARAGGVALVLAAIVGGLVIAPLLNVFDIAFHAESDLGLADDRSIKAVIAVYATLEYVIPLLHTIVLALLVTALALVVGVALAVVVARTDIPLQVPFWDILILIPLFLSPFTAADRPGSRSRGRAHGFLNGI